MELFNKKINLPFCLITSILVLSLQCCSQKRSTEFNFGFEKVSVKGALPDGWIKWAGSDGYSLTTDSIVKHSGKYSMLIEPGKNRSAGQWGSFGYSIPAIYDGKEVELKGYMKFQDIKDGFVGLFLRIDGQNQVLQFDNMKSKKIQGTKDWTIYTITLPLPGNAKKISFGALNTGTGKLWVDDIQVSIDGKDVRVAKLKGPSNIKAENDHQFDSGSGVNAIPVSSISLQNLVTLGKVWGFLKYYHPAIAKGDYNWDYELFRVLPDVMNCKSTKEGNRVLSAWIDKLEHEGMNPFTSYNSFDSSEYVNVKVRPDYEWINDTLNLGNSLSYQLNQIKNSKRSGSNYYVSLAQGVGNPQFDNENAYEYFICPDAGFRLLAVYRYWNIINYYYPNKHLIGRNWDSVLVEYIPNFLNATDNLSYHLAALQLIAEIHDTHANIYGDTVLEHYMGRNSIPVKVKFIENKAVVCAIKKDMNVTIVGLDTGDIILTINNKSIDDIIKKSLPITPASNYPTQLRNIARNLLRTNDTVLKLTYLRANKINSETIKCAPYDMMWTTGDYQKKDTCFKFLSPNIAYFYPGSIKNDYLPIIAKNIMNSKGLVIDLRCYPSEFIVYTFSRYLMPSSTNFVKFSNGSIITPGLFTYTQPVPVGEDGDTYYKGKVVILVNETTQSQAEFTAMAFRVAPHAIVLGSTTAGADGNISYISLPGKIRTLISGIGVYYPDGKETQRVGIVPDIILQPTIKGIQEKRDELLEKAIQIINQVK